MWPMTLDCDLDLGHQKQNFVCNTLSYFSWPFCENLIKFTLATYDLYIVTLNLGNGNKNIVCDTPV